MEKTLEEAAEEFYEENAHNITFLMLAEFGAKWQQKRSYSEKEVLGLLNEIINPFNLLELTVEEWFEQFKKK